jgi:hypothetical protein
MDLDAILKQLKEHHAKVDQSIRAMELIEAGNTHRRGRPPKWLTTAKAGNGSKRRGRPAGSGKRAGSANTE